MNRNINLEISNPKKFISDIENKNFVEIPGSDIWDLGYSTEPHHNNLIKKSKKDDFILFCVN